MSDQRNFMDTGTNPYRAPASQLAHTPNNTSVEHSKGPIELADRASRLWAHLLDQALTLAAMVPGVAVLMGFLFLQETRDMSDLEIGGIGLGIGLIMLGMLAVVGVQAYLVTTTGQSVGKRWLKIKIIRMDGSECGFVYGVLVRSWVMAIAQSMLSAFGSILGLVDTFMIFREDRRCLHDHMAGTQVIVAHHTPEIPRPF